MKNQGVTIVFVSHDLEAVRTLADRTIWMEHGSVKLEGKTDEVVAKYLAAMVGRGRKEAEQEAIGKSIAAVHLTIWIFRRKPLPVMPAFISGIPNMDHRYGNGKARIEGIGVFNAAGDPTSTAAQGDRLCVRISVEFARGCEASQRRIHASKPPRPGCDGHECHVRGTTAGTGESRRSLVCGFRDGSCRSCTRAFITFRPPSPMANSISTRCATGSTMLARWILSSAPRRMATFAFPCAFAPSRSRGRLFFGVRGFAISPSWSRHVPTLHKKSILELPYPPGQAVMSKIASHLFEVRWIRVCPFQGCRFAPPLANVRAALRAAVLHAGGVPRSLARSERAIASHSGLVLSENRTPNAFQASVKSYIGHHSRARKGFVQNR